MCYTSKMMLTCFVVCLCFVATQAKCEQFGGVEHGKTTVVSNLKFQETQTIRIDCDEGYILSGEKYVYCKNERWTRRGFCKSFLCPVPQSLQSRCLESVVLDDAKPTVNCRTDLPSTDLEASNHNDSVCLKNGSWSNTDVGCLCHCEIWFDKHTTIVQGVRNVSYIPHGEQISWHCSDGYTKDPHSIDTCFDGTIRLVCVPSTPKPSAHITNSSVHEVGPNSNVSAEHGIPMPSASASNKTNAPTTGSNDSLESAHIRDIAIVLIICSTVIVICTCSIGARVIIK